MKILIAADIFPPQSGGPATYAVILANELVKRGDEVRIVSLNPKSDKQAVKCEVAAVKSQNKLFKYWQYFWLLWKWVRLADVVYAMGPVNAGLSALLVTKLRSKKFVVKVVGDYAWEQGVIRFDVADAIEAFQDKNKYPLPVKFLRRAERYVAQKANKVIVPSKYLKRIVAGWGVKDENIAVVYNKVEYITANIIPHNDEKWVVTVGRLVPWKGMATLIDVVAGISRQFPEAGWKLKIIGAGPEMDKLKKQIKENDLDKIVQMTGALSKMETLEYMASADVFVLNSGYEGFPHTLIEALNQGVPVLASRAGGNAEVLAADALFECNNKEEIKKKILFYSTFGKKDSVQHLFLIDMITETKRILENL